MTEYNDSWEYTIDASIEKGATYGEIADLDWDLSPYGTVTVDGAHLRFHCYRDRCGGEHAEKVLSQSPLVYNVKVHVTHTTFSFREYKERFP